MVTGRGKTHKLIEPLESGNMSVVKSSENLIEGTACVVQLTSDLYARISNDRLISSLYEFSSSLYTLLRIVPIDTMLSLFCLLGET
jgi:hypothetical protein